MSIHGRAIVCGIIHFLASAAIGIISILISIGHGWGERGASGPQSHEYDWLFLILQPVFVLVVRILGGINLSNPLPYLLGIGSWSLAVGYALAWLLGRGTRIHSTENEKPLDAR